VITAKCVDRIERSMERAGCPIARSTLCSFFHRSAELLEPIYDQLLETAKINPYLHADETRLSVQHEGKCLQGWVWGLFCATAIVYTFDESRSGRVAEKLLEGTEGFLVIDGYAGYNGVVADDDATGRTRVGCWAHARRRFFEALSSEPDARKCLDWIVELYHIEHRAAERDILGTEVHLALRESESREVLKQLEQWLDEHDGHYPPKSYMGKAIGYAVNNREELGRFLEDANLPLDNNFAERCLRIIAIGRKNFLFAGHAEGAQNLAVLQSIVSTCRLHGVNPYEYVKDVLIRIQTHPANRLDEIMPWNWKPPPKLASDQLSS
jgi:transposase